MSTEHRRQWAAEPWRKSPACELVLVLRSARAAQCSYRAFHSSPSTLESPPSPAACSRSGSRSLRTTSAEMARWKAAESIGSRSSSSCSAARDQTRQVVCARGRKSGTSSCGEEAAALEQRRSSAVGGGASAVDGRRRVAAGAGSSHLLVGRHSGHAAHWLGDGDARGKPHVADELVRSESVRLLARHAHVRAARHEQNDGGARLPFGLQRRTLSQRRPRARGEKLRKLYGGDAVVLEDGLPELDGLWWQPLRLPPLREDRVDVARVDTHEEHIPAKGQPERPADWVEVGEDKRGRARRHRKQPQVENVRVEEGGRREREGRVAKELG